VQSGTGTPLTSGNAALTGTISNGAVSLHEELGATLVGTIQGSDLIMQIPQPDGTVEPYMFHPGSAAEYNAQLQKLAAQLQNQRSTVTSQQQAAKTAQDQSNAGQSLANDLSKLGADEGAVSDANNALPAGKKRWSRMLKRRLLPRWRRRGNLSRATPRESWSKHHRPTLVGVSLPPKTCFPPSTPAPAPSARWTAT